MKELELIQQFESVFREAGQLASDLRKSATIQQKVSSGVPEIDIVTSADLSVQEFILQKLAYSELRNCEVVAEENTPSKALFSPSADLVITIDPIDGTMLYAQGKKMYTTIVTMHDKKRPIYTFDYYPEVNWGLKIVKDKVEFFGDVPDVKHEKFLKAITYTSFGSREPERTIPNLRQQLVDEGYQFVNKKEISSEIGATGQFLLGYADGCYYKNGSAVDCLVALHYGLANGYKIYQELDLSKPIKSDISSGTEEYNGYYVVVR